MSADTVIRRARAEDVAAIVGLLADDALGARRERPGDPAYAAAFAEIDASPMHEQLVAERQGEIVGCLQLTYLHGLSRCGATRALIEGVRIAASARGQKLGEQLVLDAVERARRKGCSVVQLTTDNSRVDAQRFYARLGFKGTHMGMKLEL